MTADPNTTPDQSDGRIHGLDALRGILMMLGVVLHAGVSRLWRQSGDGAGQGLIESVMGFIHIFRMPAFFLLSGFFGALLWYRRGPSLTLKNRFQRLVLPFLAFLFILWPLLFWGGAYLASLYEGHSEPIWRAFGDAMAHTMPPVRLIHLWFLYYLIIITAVAASAVLWMERREVTWPRLHSFVRRTFESPWRSLLVLGGINALWFFLCKWDDIPTSDSWVPDPIIFFYYLAFYVFGWIVYSAKIDLQALKDHAWTQIGLGCLFAAIYYYTWYAAAQANRSGDDLARMGWYLLRSLSIAGALVSLTRGLIGVFIRHANSGAYGWRYISDASYWVYLFHIIVCMVVPYLLLPWDAPLLVKYGASIVLTTLICIVTYDICIRPTWGGKFLNGRRYPAYSVKLSVLAALILGGWATIGWSHLSDRHQVLLGWRAAGGNLSLVPFTRSLSPWTLIDDTEKAPKEIVEHCVPLRGYVYCSRSTKRETARTVCSAMKGALLVLETTAENTIVNDSVAELTKKPFWLDLDDLAQEGRWMWHNGVALDYNGWDETQPDSNGGNEDCAAGNWGGSKKWHDVPCEAELPFICEPAKGKPTVP